VHVRVAPPPLHAAASERARLQGMLARSFMRCDVRAAQLRLTPRSIGNPPAALVLAQSVSAVDAQRLRHILERVRRGQRGRL
jgi:hypothetical protein